MRICLLQCSNGIVRLPTLLPILVVFHIPNDVVPVNRGESIDLIAINYPARALGLTSRHVSASEAKKLVPTLRCVHVATWQVGGTQWSYPEPGLHDINASKACLDPYRIESKKILSIFRRNCEMVEKASVDESFLDLSKMVWERVAQRYKEVLGVLPPSGVTEQLPLPPGDSVQWSGSSLVELDGEAEEVEGDESARPSDEQCGEGEDNANEVEQTMEEPMDWDDVCLAIGAEIVAVIRGEVRRELKYTCSAGIARNKMLAKLASGYKKPNNQTVVRTRAVRRFLRNIKFTKSEPLMTSTGLSYS